MSKYQVGDKVRVRSDLIIDEGYGGTFFISVMKQYCGKILTISHVNPGDYKVEENDWYWSDEMFEEKVENMFTKKDLKTGMIATCRNGKRYVVMLGTIMENDIKDILVNDCDWLNLGDFFRNDLSCNIHIFDVVKVEKLKKWGYHRILSEYKESFFETVWEREEQLKEINLTVAIIKHRGTSKSYWFEVPSDVKVEKGQTVLVDTSRGKDTGWVFQVLKFRTQADLDEYIKNNNVVGPKFPLKKVIGVVRNQ